MTKREQSRATATHTATSRTKSELSRTQVETKRNNEARKKESLGKQLPLLLNDGAKRENEQRVCPGFAQVRVEEDEPDNPGEREDHEPNQRPPHICERT